MKPHIMGILQVPCIFRNTNLNLYVWKFTNDDISYALNETNHLNAFINHCVLWIMIYQKPFKCFH